MQTQDYEDLYQLEAQFWWFVGMRTMTASLLEPLLATSRDRTILDAGCGTGGNLEWLRRWAGRGQIIGLDYVGTALQFCRQAGHDQLVQASATHLPFANAVFDLVTSFDVLEQLRETEDRQALSEMYRVLRPGGIAFVRVPAYEWMKSGHDAALHSQHRYSLVEVQAKLARAGFTIRRATYANSLLLPVAAVRRLVLKRLGLVDEGSDVKPLPRQLQWLNAWLEQALRLEANWLRHSGRSLPYGLSAICVVEKSPG